MGERRLLEKKYLCIDLREYRESILLEKNPSTLALALCIKMGWGRVVFIGKSGSGLGERNGGD